ncbi:MAG: glycosyltransferase family 4 protein [Phycisphaeraceae bacterium]|nr:glycosyltransferase [Phycisphaerales bacterium]QOJ18307.1 MAG: glycosyltransferase family 4 protein [Phycisphaeraceae bacterium]
MHVAILFDAERLMHERAMLNRLCIALIGEGVQVTRIVPDEVADEAHEDDAVALAGRAGYPGRAVWWAHGDRVRKLADRFGKAPPDVLLALGEATWRLARDLAAALQRPLIVETWSWRTARRLSARLAPPAGLTVITPADALAQRIRRRLKSIPVEVVPWGVPFPDEPTSAPARRGDSLALAVIGPGDSTRPYRAFVPALARFLRETTDALATCELDGRRSHDVWRLLRDQRLLERVSIISRASAHRTLLTQCDAVIAPEATGMVRSVFLEALANGVPVIAAEDNCLDFLKGGETAMVIAKPSQETWLESLRRLVTQPTVIQSLTSNGRRLAEQRHRVSRQAEQLAGLLTRSITGDAIPFRREPA